MEYWVSVEKVYKLWSDVELTEEQAQVLIENGQGSLKEVNWGFDGALQGKQECKCTGCAQETDIYTKGYCEECFDQGCDNEEVH